MVHLDHRASLNSIHANISKTATHERGQRQGLHPFRRHPAENILSCDESRFQGVAGAGLGENWFW